MQSFFLVGIAGAAGAVSRYGVGLQDGASHLALLNVSANLILGLGAVWLGFMSTRLALPAV